MAQANSLAANGAKTQFGYRRHVDQDRSAADIAGHPVVVVGAGPVGLSFAIDLAQRGHKVVLLDDADRIGEGSRAICFSKRSLEYWDRLGVGDRMVDKGVVWSVGRIFHGPSELYQFNLLPEDGHKRPAFINLQQFYAEAYLVDRIEQLPAISLRWRNKVTALEQRNDGVLVSIATPEGPYRLHAAYVIACDGARSSLRQMVGAEFAGQVFEDQFLIADVKMTAEFPTERWFWFDPPFHAGRSALLHKQPDDVWRIDLQLRPDADPAAEKRPESLLESYHIERSAAADENIRESTRSTDFMAPSTAQEARLRKAVLALANETEFGKRMVNGGRLSVPTVYDSPLSTPDSEAWRGGPRPGTSMYDAPIDGRYLTDAFIEQGKRFTCLAFGNGGTVEGPDGVGMMRVGGEGGFADRDHLASKRYDAESGTTYLLRPDGYVAARFRHPTRAALDAALSRAAGLN